jgi:GNAT superfamily N-acetyltransferase
MTEPHYVLRPPRSAADWRDYHDIRRIAIFALHLPDHAYDVNDPDEFAPDNFPHVFLDGGAIIGTIRIDWIDVERAGFRLIAIRPELQGRGHGAAMMGLAERIAIASGRHEAVINAHPKAARFYLDLGYATGDWHDCRALSDGLVRVGKRLPD